MPMTKKKSSKTVTHLTRMTKTTKSVKTKKKTNTHVVQKSSRFLGSNARATSSLFFIVSMRITMGLVLSTATLCRI